MLPIPPSDSFYKFTCIGYLVVAGAMFFWIVQTGEAVDLRRAEIERRLVINAAELEVLTEEGQALKRDMANMRKGAPNSLVEAERKWQERHKVDLPRFGGQFRAFALLPA